MENINIFFEGEPCRVLRVNDPKEANLIVTIDGRILFAEKGVLKQNEEVKKKLKKLSKKEIELYLCELMEDLSIPLYVKGYNIVKDALIWMIENNKSNPKLYSGVYSILAENNGVSDTVVSELMNNMIERTWHEESDLRNKLFAKKPSNREFLTEIYWCFKNKYM